MHPSWAARGRRVLLIAVMAALAMSGVTSSGGHPAAWAQSEGLRVEGTVTYRLEPAEGMVKVTADLELTNTLPARVRGAFIETPYFDSFAVPAAGPVADASARSSNGRGLPVSVESQSEGVEAVVVDLVPNLVHGSPQKLSVEFTLPGQQPRSSSVTRVNEAFAAWLLLAAEPTVEVVVDVPESFHVTFSHGVAGAISQRDGRRTYRLPPSNASEELALFATARNDDRFDTREVDVGGRTVTVEAWPDDPEWAGFAVDTVERGLPSLRDTLGLELPDRALTVVESTSGYHLGFAGVYMADLNLIEVGDELDRHVMLHELSHLWLNPNLFADRWIYEGLADDVSARVAENLGEPPLAPEPVDLADPHAVALNDWTAPEVLDPDRHERDRFAYNAAWSVTRQLIDDIGMPKLRAVLRAADDGRMIYGRDGTADPATTPLTDWRYFYDLLELVGEASGTRSVFVDHVLGEDQVALLDQRDAARASLADLEQSTRGWAAPFAVRYEMSRWRFDAAQGLIDATSPMLERIDRLADEMRPAGIDPRQPIRRPFESADDLEELDVTLDRFTQVGNDLTAVHVRRAQEDLIGRVGLVGTGDTLATARDAYLAGDLGQADRLTADAAATVDRSTQRGIAIVLAVILLTATIGAHVRFRRHRITA